MSSIEMATREINKSHIDSLSQKIAAVYIHKRLHQQDRRVVAATRQTSCNKAIPKWQRKY